MKKVLPDKLERGRVAGDSSWGAYGKFFVRMKLTGPVLCVIASAADDDDKDSDGWEHVSVSTAARCPTWEEMCFVKDLFWEPEECVVQFHPPRSEYVNNHPNVLHLWRHKTELFRTPPSILVGVKSEGLLTPERARALRLMHRLETI